MRSANYVVTLFYFDHETLHITRMASVRHTDCYVFSNNLEAILLALEENDKVERDLSDTVNKASIS